MRGLARLVVGFVERVGIFVVLVLAWQIAVDRGWADPFFVSSPSEIAGVVVRWAEEGRIFRNLLLTLQEATLGYALGTTLGTGLGFLFAFVPRVALVLEPFVVLLNAFPRLTLAPLFIVWFGFGMAPKVLLVAAFILFICFFNTYKGLREVDQELLDRARLWGASRWQLAASIYLPATVSWILSGLRASVGFALIGAVVAEYIGGDAGVGYLIMQGQTRLRMREVLAGLTLLLAVAAGIEMLLRTVEARALRWRPVARPGP